MSGDEIASPKIWQRKILMAMAEVCAFAGTDSMMETFTGLVDRKKKSWVNVRKKINVLMVGAYKVPIKKGSERAIEMEESLRWPPFPILADHRSPR